MGTPCLCRAFKGGCGHVSRTCGWRPELAVALVRSWQQLESFVCGWPPPCSPQLAVDVLGMGAHGVQGHHESTRDVRAIQVGPQQPEDFELALAQRIERSLPDGQAVLYRAGGAEQGASVPRRDPALVCLLQQNVS